MKTSCPKPLSKPLVTEKRQNKAKYLNRDSIRLKFVKNISMPNPVKNTGYIKCYNSSSLGAVKSPSNSMRCNCQNICSWSRRPNIILKIRKKATFLSVINKPFTNKFSGFTNHEKRTKSAVVFSCRSLSNILKCRDRRWVLPKI